MKANINDRASVEQIYPRDTFEQDGGRNSVGNASVLYGLKIMSQPDAKGTFELTVAKRQTGERDPEGDAVFLPPYLVRDAAGTLPGPERKSADYASYIDRVLETARSADFKSPLGPDSRLAGFHGG